MAKEFILCCPSIRSVSLQRGLLAQDPTHGTLHQAFQCRNTFGRFQNNIQISAGSRLMKGIFARRFQVHDFVVSFHFDQYLFTARNHPDIVLTVTTVHILCRISQSDEFSSRLRKYLFEPQWHFSSPMHAITATLRFASNPLRGSLEETQPVSLGRGAAHLSRYSSDVDPAVVGTTSGEVNL